MPSWIRKQATCCFNSPTKASVHGRTLLRKLGTPPDSMRSVGFESLHSTRGESPLHRLRSYLFVGVEFGRAGFSQRQPSAGRLISVNSVRIFFSGFLLTDPVMMR